MTQLNDTIQAIGQWLDSNKEWVFSGAGISVLLIVGAALKFLFFRHPKLPAPSAIPSPPQITPPRPRMDIIRERGAIRLGFFQYSPLICTDGNNCPSGIYGTIANEVFSKLGVSIEWHQINVGHAVASLNDDTIDCMVCIFQTAERAKHADFASLLHTVTVTGVVRATNRDIRSQADLHNPNVRLAVCRGEIGHELATHVLQVPPARLHVLDSPDVANVCALVQSGVVDVALADGISIKRYLSTNAPSPKLRQIFLQHPLAMCFNGFMIPRNEPDFRKWIDDQFRSHIWSSEMVQLETETLDDYHGILRKA
jgi:ABC-type amino acid transport substrate-binding protein